MEGGGRLNEESSKIDYHHGFYAATHAEYHAFREVLDFLQEQELGVEPVRLDMLIIKRDGPNPLRDPIGSFFGQTAQHTRRASVAALGGSAVPERGTVASRRPGSTISWSTNPRRTA